MPSSSVSSTMSSAGSMVSSVAHSPVMIAGVGAVAYAGYNIYNTFQGPADCPKALKTAIVKSIVKLRRRLDGWYAAGKTVKGTVCDYDEGQIGKTGATMANAASRN